MLRVTVVEWVRLPLVPVTVTVYEPAGPEHDSVEVPVDGPLKDTLLGLSVHVRPDGETVEVRSTVLVNPFRALIVIDEDALPGAVTEVGLAERLKSGDETGTI